MKDVSQRGKNDAAKTKQMLITLFVCIFLEQLNRPAHRLSSINRNNSHHKHKKRRKKNCVLVSKAKFSVFIWMYKYHWIRWLWWHIFQSHLMRTNRLRMRNYSLTSDFIFLFVVVFLIIRIVSCRHDCICVQMRIIVLLLPYTQYNL